jgi:hypothetical protein
MDGRAAGGRRRSGLTRVVRLLEVDVQERDLRFRMPFRFGAVTLEACPQLVVRIRAELDGSVVGGVAAELALPKWFDKSPGLREEDNVVQLRRSLAIAVEVYRGAGRERSAFGLHRAGVREDLERCAREALPPLVASFGVALLDRALIDAVCRSAGLSFFDAVRSNVLGIDASLTPELSGFDLDGFLAGLRPSAQIAARHTVGLVDPLTSGDLRGPRPADPLPCTLEECVAFYGNTQFKLKLSGRADADVDRLTRIAAVLDRLPAYQATLDGNEQYRDAEAVAAFWDLLEANPKLDRLRSAILFVEQPIARAVALSAPVTALARRRPVEIDESDGSLDAFVMAKELGYTGVSSKACKGVYRSILNRARCVQWNAQEKSDRYFMSAEDLIVQAGVSLQQDLSLATLIGCTHGERNGHHYVNGLAQASREEQERVLQAYPNLYRRDDDGIVRLAIRGGKIQLGDLAAPGFGSRSEAAM